MTTWETEGASLSVHSWLCLFRHVLSVTSFQKTELVYLSCLTSLSSGLGAWCKLQREIPPAVLPRNAVAQTTAKRGGGGGEKNIFSDFSVLVFFLCCNSAIIISLLDPKTAREVEFMKCTEYTRTAFYTGI